MSTEVLSYSPDLQGKMVLELTSRPSQVTDALARSADHVTSVVIDEKALKTEQEKYKHLKHVRVMKGDYKRLDFPRGSFDLILCHSFLNDAEDGEASALLRSFLGSLRPDGHLCLVEPSASLNPVPSRRDDYFVSRTHTQYCYMVMCSATSEAAFQILRGKNLMAVQDTSGRHNMVCLVAKRVPREGDENQETLMDIRYSQTFIFRLEWIFGHTFVSTGGEATTRHFCGRFGLRHNQRVLDVGCGTGGSAFFMARHYGVEIHGVDISTNMINIAIERLGQCESRLKNKIQFEIQDIVEADYDSNTYDLIYSRDVILHIHEKDKLFAKLHRWLKPGGILFITDYCKGTGEATQNYLEYEKAACSKFVTVSAYGSLLRAAGFRDVKEEDLAKYFNQIQKEEHEAFLPTKEEFVRQYSQEEFDSLAQICANKLVWVKNGQFTWGAFTATK